MTIRAAAESFADDGGEPVLILDLDGVLLRGDSMASLIVRRLAAVPWRAPCVLLLLLAALVAPADGRWRPRCNRAIVRVALRGVDANGYAELVAVTAPQLAPRADERVIARAADFPGRVVVVTATEESLARAFLERTALAGAEVLGSQFAFSPAMRWAAHTVGAAKVSALRAHGITIAAATFITDSASDLPLLRLVRRGLLVRPTARTRRAVVRAGLAERVRIWC